MNARNFKFTDKSTEFFTKKNEKGSIEIDATSEGGKISINAGEISIQSKISVDLEKEFRQYVTFLEKYVKQTTNCDDYCRYCNRSLAPIDIAIEEIKNLYLHIFKEEFEKIEEEEFEKIEEEEFEEKE